MAAVAREPGAAAGAASTNHPEHRPPDPASSTPGLPLLLSDLSGPRQSALFPERDESSADRSHVSLGANVSSEANTSAELTKLTQPEELTELRSLLRDSVTGKAVSDPSPGVESDPVQSAVSPLSLPAAPEAPEAGLSLGQPNGPDRGFTERTMSGSPDRSFAALREPRDVRGPAGDRGGEDSARDLEDSGPELRPGTQVRVSLDHVIDDALVVSFRVGHKVFSGVLMDLSRRFGPYGIPVTAFPSRQESSRRHVASDPTPPDPKPPDPTPLDPSNPAVTPLFHVGAPYPPPLFLRDSYHQSLPQPPPRRIKRSRRRYTSSEEPTCMLVRLRPRQVLCDRCKGAATPRAPPVSAQRRRTNTEPIEENMSAEVKRLRGDEPRPLRPRREAPKRDRLPVAGRTNSGTSLKPGTSTRTSSTGLRSSVKSSDPVRSRVSPNSSRVLTRRIASALASPRIRLKPHRSVVKGC